MWWYVGMGEDCFTSIVVVSIVSRTGAETHGSLIFHPGRAGCLAGVQAAAGPVGFIHFGAGDAGM